MTCEKCDKNNPYECTCTCAYPKALGYEMSVNLNFDFIPTVRKFQAGTMSGCEFINHIFCYNFTPCDICQNYNGMYILTHPTISSNDEYILTSNSYCSDFPPWSYTGALVKIQLFGNFSHKKCRYKYSYDINNIQALEFHQVLRVGLLPLLNTCPGYIPVPNPIIGGDPFQYYYYIMPAFTEFNFEGDNVFKFWAGNPYVNSMDQVCDFTEDITVSSYAV